MNSYPNQKIITKFDYAKCSDIELHAKINIEAM